MGAACIAPDFLSLTERRLQWHIVNVVRYLCLTYQKYTIIIVQVAKILKNERNII